MLFVINAGHTSRNYAYSGDIMGTDKKESEDYLCTKFSIKNSISITVKNIGLHLDPFFVGDIGNKFIEKFHLMIGKEINDPATNLFKIKFTCKPGLKNHEDFNRSLLTFRHYIRGPANASNASRHTIFHSLFIDNFW